MREYPSLATIDGVAAFLSAATDLGPSALSPVGGRDHDAGMDEPANTSVEWLDRDECLRLLAADEVGRLAVVVGHAPMIVPVNYRLDGDRVVFRSDPGTKVDYGLRSPVAFEIDGIDRAAHTGWSVVVAGRLEEPPPYDTKDLEHLHSLPVRPWAGGEKARWLRIVPSHITGRRLGALTRR